MPSRSDQISAGDHRRFSAYVSVPDTPNGNAVIVLQEIFGITALIREVADRYAREGYLAIAPDLYWRIEPGVSLSHSKEDMQRALAMLAQFDERLAIDDIGCAIAHAKAQPGIEGGGVAVVGMCLGGKLAYLAAARLPVDASVAFYGVGIEKNLDEASRINAPLLMFFGGLDQYAPPLVRRQIEAATAGNPKVGVRVYDHADHGFYTRGEPEVIRSAHAEATSFLREHLPGRGAAA